ncbi:Putative phagocytic receptor 1b [Monoraphidium neglectum]|uniref:Transmembrane 9 superfamily member n=1 Tax=Monoraphidium neglectum TaxID=145388 RepID=A0A0D2LPM6_9CHLO|nr:Putative phagocytic receptor 1b [Monoraphidium neglectum]KIY91946.1 Putative phagocytic receptor 1b [Monoraphidium neglectum]|eukprot:XP_013890966.1 Putative phagocytic receptor 1b [Monoraphidium neglectum]
MYYDNLPVWGFVGKVEKIIPNSGEPQYRYYVFTHMSFDIKYNGDRVIEINVLTDPAHVADVSEGAELPTVAFTYSVKWVPTTIPYEDRLQRYERFPLNPVHLEIHWFSIINSCVTVLLLTGFLATILLRVLKADFVKFSRGEDGAPNHSSPSLEFEEEESGWKYVHGDVFRFPPGKAIFAAFVGTGTQVLTLSFFIFGLSLIGVFYPYNRGALFTAMIVLPYC